MRGQSLSPEQYTEYRRSHRRLIAVLLLAVAYCVGIVIVHRFVSVDPVGFYITIAGFPIVGICIWGMAKFRCPVCRSTPRAKSIGFTSGEATYSSMVALRPEECAFCGVRFACKPASEV